MSAKFGQGTPPIPTSLPPSGTAGGQLSGTYPNPSVTSSHSGSTHAAATASAVSTSAAAVAAAGGSALIGDDPTGRTILTGATVFANIGTADGALAARVVAATLAGTGGSGIVGDLAGARTVLTGSTVLANLDTADGAFGLLIGGFQTAGAFFTPGKMAAPSTPAGTTEQFPVQLGRTTVMQTANAEWRIRGSGRFTTSATPDALTFRLRFGPAGDATDVAVCTLAITPTLNQTDGAFYLDAQLSIRTTGAGGTCVGNLVAGLKGATAAMIVQGTNVNADVAVDTTVSNIISLSYQCTTLADGILTLSEAVIHQVGI